MHAMTMGILAVKNPELLGATSSERTEEEIAVQT
jgi:hypothetical protein